MAKKFIEQNIIRFFQYISKFFANFFKEITKYLHPYTLRKIIHCSQFIITDFNKKQIKIKIH